MTVRLVLTSDRELDYVHLKDRRAATFEPVDALSGYQYKSGLGYYFAPGDLATNFFIDNFATGHLYNRVRSLRHLRGKFQQRAGTGAVYVRAGVRGE